MKIFPNLFIAWSILIGLSEAQIHAQQTVLIPAPGVPAAPPSAPGGSVAAGASEQYDRVPWHTPRVTFAPQQMPLRDLLKEFAIAQHLPMTISESVKGVISGTFTDVDTQKFLESLCEAHDLVWFYDGVRMSIETSEEVVSRPLSLGFVTPEAIRDVIFSIGYDSGPAGREVQVKQGHRSGVILLVGGPQFVQATEALARDLDAQENKRQSEQIAVRTFRLNYASASDITVNDGSTTRIIPGVVRSLQNLMTTQGAGAALSTGPEQTNPRRTRQGLLGSGLAAVGNPNAGEPRGVNPYLPGGGVGQLAPSATPAAGRDAAQQPTDSSTPMIVADTRLNAVLVKDVATRMPLYEELVKMLDVQTRAIEITAAIVDIDANNGRNLGIELLGFANQEALGVDKNNDLQSGRIGFDADRGLFDPPNTQGQISSFREGSDLARGVGLNLTALIAGNGYDLLTRLRAIERTGAGQVLSSPSVFTMENVTAVIRTQETVYVRVQGNMATDLFDVSTGVQLRVTPTIVDQDGRSDFRLVIDITDGSFSSTNTVDAIPATRESGINTQAMVPENKTLLLGGYTVERRTSTDNGVPFLSRIPVVGKVLSRNERNHERRQRFFFITPRLVDLNKETTSPEAYTITNENELEINPRLEDGALHRETPEDMARRLAATFAKTPPPPKRPTAFQRFMTKLQPEPPAPPPAYNPYPEVSKDKLPLAPIDPAPTPKSKAKPNTTPQPAAPQKRQYLLDRLFKKS